MDPFEAIDAAILSAYPGLELIYLQPVPARVRALNGFVLAAIGEPQPYWLIVSQGLTDLWEKEDDDPERSGWGFELTCRATRAGEDIDCGWVAVWMQHIADYLAESGAYIEAGHSKLMIQPDRPDELCAVAFVDDVQLEATASRNGRSGFLQLLCLNHQEFRALQSWTSQGFAELMRARDPLLMADPTRPSTLDDAAMARAVEAGAERDGSSMGGMTGVDVMWFEHDGELQIHLSHDAVEWFEHALRRRLPYAQPMLLRGDPARPNSLVVLRPGRWWKRRWHVEEHGGQRGAIVPLADAAQAELLDALARAPRRVKLPWGFTLPSVRGLRFVLTDPATFHEARYPF